MEDSKVPCDACLSGSIFPGNPRGVDNLKLAGLTYYLAEGTKGSTKAVVLGCDLFGLGIPNPRLVADKIAAETGFPVYVPDLMEGDYAPSDKLTPPALDTPIAGLPWFTRTWILIKAVGSVLRYVGPRYLYRHRSGVLLPLLSAFCEALKKEEGVESLGMVGYCLGGQVATLYAGLEDCTISAFVVAHPAPLTLEDFKKIQVPYALICAEEDFAFGPIKAGAIEVLQASKYPHAIYEHPGTAHGFGCRADLKDPHLKKEFEKNLVETIQWFKAHL